MKKNNNYITLKDFFENDEDFKNALADACIIEKIKEPTKYSINIEDLEKEIFKLVSNKEKFTFKVLFTNYKRYFYKHILEIEKTQK